MSAIYRAASTNPAITASGMKSRERAAGTAQFFQAQKQTQAVFEGNRNKNGGYQVRQLRGHLGGFANFGNGGTIVFP